jgi:GWxTD domain-containing protein
MFRLMLALVGALLAFTTALVAQEQELTGVFDENPIYEKVGVLQGKGEIPFYATVSFLKGTADSTQAVLGIALSNSAFQFVKERSGYRARYDVDLRIEGKRGSFRSRWKEVIRVASFDETLINRETIVFQSTFGLVPGEYELKMRVRDSQSGEDSEVKSDLQVPRISIPAGGHALSEPVLLRLFSPPDSAGARDHVLYPSHYYEAVPDEVSFLVEVYAGPGATEAPLKLAVSLAAADTGEASSSAAAVSSTVVDVPALTEGSARVYGSVPGTGMESGLYRLRVELQDEGGATLAESSTRIAVSAMQHWVKEHWKEAVQLLAYEATDDEREELERTPAERRLPAWKEFWEVRDPVPATPANEAFEAYFSRIAVANARFGSRLRPGWKSDRGHVYVTLGPPSDIIRRPMPTGRGFPLEVWVYDTPGFEIIFEDRIGFGNYQISNPGTFANELAALQRRKQKAIEARREALRQQDERQEGA